MAAPATPITDPVPANICAQMVESATRSCQPLLQVPSEPASTTADSLAALSTAFTFGSILLGILALAIAIPWARHVAASAKEEAQKAAKERADGYIQEWLAKEAPAIIQAHVELLNDATVGEGDDAQAADNLGKEAG